MKWMYCLALAIGLLAAGCSSKVYVLRSESANMAKYRTYQWVETKAHESDHSSHTSAFAEISVRNSVREALEKEGWKEVRQNPDVLLGYDILADQNAGLQTNAVPTQPFTRVYYNPYLRRWGQISYPRQFTGYNTYTEPVKDATLALTMVDAKTGEALWQGWATERITTTRLTEEAIDNSVKKILDKLDAQ